MRPDCIYILNGKKLTHGQFHAAVIEDSDLVKKYSLSDGGVPNMPMSKTWHEMAMRRVIQMAAQGGYDSVAWTTGEQQNERFDLSKQLDRVIYWAMPDGTYGFSAFKKGNDRSVPDMKQNNLTSAQLEDFLGKDLTKRIVDRENPTTKSGDTQYGEFNGLDLKVGGEGMKGFYDNILVKYADKFGKKFGAKVGFTKVGNQDLVINKTYRNGKRQYELREADSADPIAMYDTEKEAQEAASSMRAETVHSIDITPQMREAADDGLPLFSLSKNKKEALAQAREALKDVRGADNSIRDRLGKLAALTLHPHQIASLHKSFTGVYMESLAMRQTRDIIVHKLSNYLDLYNKMPQPSKKRINAVLEIGTLSRKNFTAENGKIVVKNESHKDAQHSKIGQTITLTGKEVDAYLNTRKAMDEALDKYIEAAMVEYGLTDMGLKTKQDISRALSAAKDPIQISRLQEALKMIKEIEYAKMSGYIPLKRWGEIGITVRTRDGEKPELVNFKRVEISKIPLIKGVKKVIGDNKEVQQAIAELRKKYPASDFDIEVFEVKDFENLRLRLNLNDLDVLAASSDMSNADYEALRAALSEAMKARGFRAHFFKRNDVPGYDPDFERAVNDYVVSIAGHLSRRIHLPKLDEKIKEIADRGEETLLEYAQEYVDYVTDAQEEFAVVRQTGFMMYIAGVSASGITNLLQPAMVTAPWFKAMFKHSQIAKQMAAAYNDTRKMIDVKEGLDFFNFDKAPADVKDALLKANESGYFIPLNTFDAMAIATTSSAHLRGIARKGRFIMDVASSTFSIPERTNRIVTFVSAYRFAIDPANRQKIMDFVAGDQRGQYMLKNLSGAEFAEAFGKYAVESTQLVMGKLNRPKIGRGFATLPTQFLSFTFQMLELQYRLARVHGAQSGTALAIMLFTVVAMSGLKGFPFEDDVQKMFEAAYKTLTRKDIDIDTEVQIILTNAVGPTAAEGIMYGLPTALVGVDMSARLGYGNIVPDDQSDLLGIWWDMLVMRPQRMAESIARGDYVQAAADILPNALSIVAQSYAWATNGVVSRKTGDKIIDASDLTNNDIALKVLGFTSSNISAERRRIYATQRASRAVDALRSDYYDRLARAYAGRNRALQDGNRALADQYQADISSIQAERVQYNMTVPTYKQIILHEPSLMKRVQEEMVGARANLPRKQARERAAEINEAFGK